MTTRSFRRAGRAPVEGFSAGVRAALAGVVLAASFAAGGCSLFMRDTPAPIPTRWFLASPGGRAGTLVVFLPGRADRLRDVERFGLVEEMRAAGVRADTVAVDAHLGYYFNRTVVARLEADVLAPARAAGYNRIVLVGASLGGLGALICERELPGTASAIVLFGPYLGDEEALFRAIDAAGGPAAWAAGRDPRAGRPEEQLWTFLGNRSSSLPPTWLLAGDRDYLAMGHRTLAPLLPESRVNVIEGGHDWATWRVLWRGVCRGSSLFRGEKTGGGVARGSEPSGTEDGGP